MREDSARFQQLERLAMPAMIVLIFGVWLYTRVQTDDASDEHLHPTGLHGGGVISFAGDRFHAEAIVEQGGVLRLYTLGRDETRVIDIEKQSITAYVSAGDLEAVPLHLVPSPQPGDTPGRTSQFVAQLPDELAGKPLDVTIPSLRIGRERFRIAFSWGVDSHVPGMPSKLADEEERALYLVAGGKYTASDIAANGSTTPSQKFRGFRAEHDFNPQPGERLCPVSRTKANSECTWIIAGQQYEFCCPPCIDELVLLAKERPAELLPPEAYVRLGGLGGSGGWCGNTGSGR